MAEFDYEVVDGRKIRVRPQEVVSEICIRHRDLATQRILRRSRSIIISIAARPMNLRSCQMDRMKPYG